MMEGNSRSDSSPSHPPAETAIASGIVEFASSLLDADRCEWLVETGDRLVVRAAWPVGAGDADRSYPRWVGIPGQSYATGLACVVDDLLDVRSSASAVGGGATSSPGYRSLCCAPVDGWGLLAWRALEPGAFTEADRDLAEQLAGLAGNVLDAATAAAPPVADGGTRDGRDHATDLEEIADILSHDLMNPLNVAKGNLALAQESTDDEYVQRAALALDRIEALVDELVILARTGDLVEQLVSVDLATRARAAWEHVQSEDATLEIEQTVSFCASERGVTHLLENVFENAVSHAGPRVTVRVGGLEHGFYVEDDGPGIPPDHRDRVFDRGYSVATETSGLGLHIVERIAAAHGWTIDVTASSAGGARFEVTGVEVGEA